MTQTTDHDARVPREIQLLTFTVMGIKIGVDAEQIAEVLDVNSAAARGLAPCLFHELISFGDLPVEYRFPKIIVIKDRDSSRAVVIDRPDNISLVSVDAIRPMPSLIALCRTARAFWGVVIQNGELIMLADCYKFPTQRQCPIPNRA